MEAEQFNQMLDTHIRKHGFALVVEIGQNHNGSPELAAALCAEAAAIPEVFAVKTAVRVPASTQQQDVRRLRSGRNSFGSNEYQHRLALELSDDCLTGLAILCRERGKLFGLSFTNDAGLERAISLKPDYFKVASQRCLDFQLLSHIPEGQAVMLATGGTTLDEAVTSVTTVRHDVWLHCNMSYPSPVGASRLSRIDMMTQYVKCSGLSSHCRSLVPDLVAYGKGCRVFEHHLTLSHNMRGTDHAASLDPNDLTELVKQLRAAHLTIGQPDSVHRSELPAVQKLRQASAPSRPVGWVGFDLDNTLAEYVHNSGSCRIGRPIGSMKHLMERLLSDGVEVRIVTARAASTVPDREEAIKAINDWLFKHIAGVPPEGLVVTAEKDPGMFALIDDRSMQPDELSAEVLLARLAEEGVL